MKTLSRKQGGSFYTTVRQVCLIALCFTLFTVASYAQNTKQKLYGGVEIGAKGVKCVAFKIIADEEDYDTEIIFQKSINTTITAGTSQTNKFSEEAMADTAKATKQLLTEMTTDKQVPNENIYIVGSSGLKADNKSELAERVKNATGKTMAFIDVEQEIKLSISGLIPEKHNGESLLIDIGSGNTKGGYRINDAAKNSSADDTFMIMSIPYGTVAFTNAINDATGSDPATFAKQADKLASELLTPSLRQQIDRRPGLANRRRIYLSGGIVWAMATLLHPEKRKSFTKITAQDINQLYQMATSNSDALLNPDLSKIDSTRIREEAKQEVQKVRDTFTAKNLIAGAKILKVLSTEFGLQNKSIYFARNGQTAWLFSYINQQL